MGNIVLLDELTINKIAAGEVIERPASAIKEMMENSIDAGASNITIEIKNGGISYIRITDNGKGIKEDDLELAFERHATSKIRSVDDLSKVKSMGFRGEALASIAAISKVEMISKTAEEVDGNKIIVEGGKILEKSITGAAVGTTITVTNLFYNTPVRYKFLKKDFTESGYIEDAISRIALAHPEIAIKLINSGRTVIQTNGNNDLKTVIYSIYGKDVANSIIDVDYYENDIHVYGYIGKPEIARSNRANQVFFVNKRYVKDKTLSSAAERAYKDLIQNGKFGFLVLNLDINPVKIDANVHPAKLEIRFENENIIFKTVYNSIKNKLILENKSEETIVEQIYRQRQAESLGLELNQKTIDKEPTSIEYKTTMEQQILEPTGDETIDKSQEVLRKLQELKNQMLQEYKEKSIIIEEKKEDKNQYVEEEKKENEIQYVEETKKENVTQHAEEEKKESEPQYVEEETKIENQDKKVITEVSEPEVEYKVDYKPEYTPEFEEMYMKFFGTKPGSKQEKIEQEKKHEQEKETFDTIAKPMENISMFEDREDKIIPKYKFIGIAFENYAILEIDKEMCIINLKEAQERVLYEVIKDNYYANQHTDSQLLLLPDIITLSKKEMEIARDNKEMFKKAGFVFEEFGENTIKLTEVPGICAELETNVLFLEILREINSVARIAKREIEEKFLQTIAKKSVNELKTVTTKEEIESLMKKILSLNNPFESPDGKTMAIKMSKYDIERKFARK